MSLRVLGDELEGLVHGTPRLESIPLGTVHHWKSGDHKKIGPHAWEPVRSGSSSAPKSEPKTDPEGPHDSAKGKDATKAPPERSKAPSAAPASPIAALHAARAPVAGKADEWIDKAEGLPTDSVRAHTQKDGRWTKERWALQKAIVEKHLKPAPVPEGKRPVAVLLMGMTASGKSGLVKGIVGDGDDFVVADSDAIKAELPEYQEAIKQRARNAASIVHQESAEVAKRIKVEAVKSRRNLVIDGTGRVASSYEESIHHLKKGGYDIHLMMAHCDTDTAVERANARGKATGRWVPPSVIREMAPTIPGNFAKIAKLVDNFTLFDTNGFPPKKVWSKTNGVETEHDPDFVRAFKAKAAPPPKPEKTPKPEKPEAKP